LASVVIEPALQLGLIFAALWWQVGRTATFLRPVAIAILDASVVRSSSPTAEHQHA